MNKIMYAELKRELKELVSDEMNFIANASNFSALIFNRLALINWVGFYFKNGDELLLGPFQGKPACIRIKIGVGVCGRAAKVEKTLLVNDVHKFSGHIACDAASKSELVIPLLHNGKLFAVLDIDSPELSRFTLEDQDTLEEMVGILIQSSDIELLSKYYDE